MSADNGGTLANSVDWRDTTSTDEENEGTAPPRRDNSTDPSYLVIPTIEDTSSIFIVEKPPKRQFTNYAASLSKPTARTAPKLGSDPQNARISPRFQRGYEGFDPLIRAQTMNTSAIQTPTISSPAVKKNQEPNTELVSQLEEQIDNHRGQIVELRRVVKELEKSLETQSEANMPQFIDLATLGGLDPIDIAFGGSVALFMTSLYFNSLIFSILGGALLLLVATHDDW